MTFDESKIVRDDAGKFGEKEHTAPEASLRSPDFVPSPLSKDDIAFGRTHAGAVSRALYERTGWDPVVLAVGDGWAHDAVRMPDGRILDVTGTSDGVHILDDPELNARFEPIETETYGAPYIADLEPYLTLSDDERPYLPEARRIAGELINWVGAEDVPPNYWLIEGDDHETELIEADTEEEALDIATEMFDERYSDEEDDGDASCTLTVKGAFRGTDTYTDELVFVPTPGVVENDALRAIRNHS